MSVRYPPADQDEFYEEEEYIPYEEDDCGDEYGFMDPRIGTTLSDDGAHLTVDQFSKAQTSFLDIEFCGSPEEFQSGKASRIWKLQPQVTRHFKQITTISNRKNATTKDVAGNLNRCIPLAMTVLQQQNTLPFPVNVDIEGVLPLNLSKYGRANWRIPPDTATMRVKQPIFEPNNIITEWMYNNWRECSVESLADDIKHFREQGYSTINVDSLPYVVLVKNLSDHRWDDLKPASEHAQAIINAALTQKVVSVRPEIAEEIESALREPLSKMAESFVDLENFTAQMSRGDGQPAFNSFKGIHGELVGSEIDEGHALRSAMLSKRGCVSIKVKFDYVLF